MLLIKKEIIEKARRAKSNAEIIELLDGAITLELSTLPPYLTGIFSIAAGSNDAIRVLILSVVLEEMLHMALAANTAIAVGGAPAIRKNGLALRYPGPLPMSIDEGLTVSLQSLTPQYVETVYMGIERPDTKAALPGEPPQKTGRVAALKSGGYASIGDFYAAIIDALEAMIAAGQHPFAHPRLERQLDLSRWFPRSVPDNPSCKVFDMNTARAALETIVRQGEGAQVGEDPIDPYAGGDAFAHYFKFGEVAFARRLVKDASAPSGWSYTGEPVPWDSSRIYTFPNNAGVSTYPAGSAARYAGQAFYGAYSRLLGALDATFNGEPAMFDAAMGIMFELRLVAQQVVQHPADPSNSAGPRAAPPFQP